jgi:hypothetical protein
VAALAEGGLQAMTMSKTKIALTLVLAAGLVGMGAAVLACSTPLERPEAARETRPATASANEALSPTSFGSARVAQPEAPAQRETVLTGQVTASGNPVANARVTLIARPKIGSRAAGRGHDITQILAQTTADREGKFRVTAPGLSRERYWFAHVLAQAPGHGLGRAALKLDQPPGELTLNLPPERLLKGRLVDLQGQPAKGVKVEVRAIYGPDGQIPLGVDFDDPAPQGACWPEPVVSDAQGHFTLRNLALNDAVVLNAHGEQHGRVRFEVEAGAKAGAEVTLALPPARVLEGAVTYRDTHKPVPGARLVVVSQKARYDSGPMHVLETRADARGRFRIVPYEGNFIEILAYPPAGKPYVLVRAEVEWNKPDQIRREVNIALRRGVIVCGVVAVAPGGKPVAGASVEFQPRTANNPFFKADVNPFFSDYKEIAVTGADGKFAITVLPGPGHLLINAPTNDYVHREVVTRKLFGGIGPNRRHYADGLVELNLKPETETHQVKVALRRGVTLEGKVVGPDGKAVAAASLFCRSYVASGHTLNPVVTLAVKEGRFRVPGWDPSRPEPLYFLDPQRGLGGVAKIDPKAVGEGLTVKVQKCGVAKVRFVDKDGRPLANMRVGVEIPISPGVSFFDPAAQQEYQLMADCAWLGNLDPDNNRELHTDAQGRVVLRNLIPGARHWIVGTRPTGEMFRLPGEILAEAGKTVDLKTITVKSR